VRNGVEYMRLTLYEVRTTTKSPNDALLRSFYWRISIFVRSIAHVRCRSRSAPVGTDLGSRSANKLTLQPDLGCLKLLCIKGWGVQIALRRGPRAGCATVLGCWWDGEAGDCEFEWRHVVSTELVRSGMRTKDTREHLHRNQSGRTHFFLSF
jgi:hypothetical protein